MCVCVYLFVCAFVCVCLCTVSMVVCFIGKILKFVEICLSGLPTLGVSPVDGSLFVSPLLCLSQQAFRKTVYTIIHIFRHFGQYFRGISFDGGS